MMAVMEQSTWFMSRTLRVMNDLWVRRKATPKRLLEFLARLAYKRGEMKRTTNYRGLSIRSRFAAVYEKIGQNRRTCFTENNKLLHENQDGGRRKRGTETSLVKLAVAWDLVEDMVAIAGDIKKMFPRSDRAVGLWEMAKRGITGNAWHQTHDLDEGLHGRVMVSGELSEVYEVLQGWLEGDIGCPSKANFLVAAIAQDLQDAKLGVILYGVWIGCSFFLDDSIMLAKGMPMAQQMCTVAARRCRWYMITLSGPKTLAVRVRPREHKLATLRMEGMADGATVDYDDDARGGPNK
jgi:hypothetical protein